MFQRLKNQANVAAGKAVAFGHKIANKARGAALALVGAPILAVSAMSDAHATGGGGLGAQMISKLTGLESDVQAILVILVGVIALFILYSMIKKAR